MTNKKIEKYIYNLNEIKNDLLNSKYFSNNIRDNIANNFFNGLALKEDLKDVLSAKIDNILFKDLYILSTAYGPCDPINSPYGNIKRSDAIKMVDVAIAELTNEKEKNENVEMNIDNKSFYEKLLQACSLLQTNIVYHNRKNDKKVTCEKKCPAKKIIVDEDHRNYFIRDLFDFNGLYVRSQEHQGVSANGKGAGEVDLLICRTELQPKIYIEGMNLDCINDSVIKQHYEKLFLYDSSINKNNYLLSYVTTKDFEDFCVRYKNYFDNYSGKTACLSIGNHDCDYANIKVYVSTSNHNSNIINTYHILIFFDEE